MKKRKIYSFILSFALFIPCFISGAFAMSDENEKIPTTGGIENIQPNGEIPNKEQEPLTPEGNTTLVDDFYGDKQLITITTKSGNYFYILIDRANEDKETSVHFLNQVDESDLMSLMEDAKEQAPPTCSCEDKCHIGGVNVTCEVCTADINSCIGEEPEPEPEQTQQNNSEQINPVAILLTLGFLGVTGLFAYLKFVRNKPQTNGNDDLDDYDYGEDENADDDELPAENEDEENTDEEGSVE